MDGRRQYAAFILIVASLAAGLLVGFAAKGLMALEPTLRLLMLSALVLYWSGASFLTSFFRDEREHELRVVAGLAHGPGAKTRRMDGAPVPRPRAARAPGRALRLVK